MENFWYFIWVRNRTAVTLLGFLIFWQLVVTVFQIREFILPSPFSAILHLFFRQPDANYLWIKNISATLFEILIGFTVTVFFGIIIAVIVSWSQMSRRFFIPLFIFINSLPIVAIAPIILLWLGYGFYTNVLIAFLVSFFPMVMNTTTGLNKVDEDLLDLVRYHGAKKWQILIKIRFPNSLPYIFSGLKICSTICVVGVIVGEFVASDKGLGYIIINSQFTLDTPPIFAALIVIAVIGLGLFGLVSLLEKLLMPWQKPVNG